ncbi:tetratricopeptide repeat protein [Candidatus Magnetomonas plexicatena]|uniref:tetratricopeptide repeat protein n=1 Tax=Candidatus Magnetomonas plexicatena TaxID=2552947 RepID=UPI0011042844|nr:tetratricopeptide repeat protein [Nitrospirales bacterium LBB_01]
MTGLKGNTDVNPKSFFALLTILILTACVYIQVIHFELVSYDDFKYVRDNPHIADGLTLKGVVWALRADYDSNWFPLTWVSHMADISLFGKTHPGGHHFTNLMIHLVNVCLLFLLFKLISNRNVFLAAGAAALLALHPLNVETVAWVSERKNLLCAMFWLLSLICYVKYGQVRKRIFYFASLLFFVLALMSKPMAVTLPFVILLFDFWPLQRFRTIRWRKIAVEKIPFFVLTTLSSIVTYKLQHDTGLTADFNTLPLNMRTLNAVNSYVQYLIKLVSPVNLAVIYPYGAQSLSYPIILKTLVLILITAFALWKAKRYPYLIMGWLYYMGTLVPVIQIVQIGIAPMADRYTYLPMMGIYIMLGFGIKDLVMRFPKTLYFFISAIVVFISILSVMTYFQAASWRNSHTLYKHAIDVSPNDFVAYNNYGLDLMEHGQTDEAIAAFSKGLSIMPTNKKINYSMYIALMKKGRVDEAQVHLLISTYFLKDRDKQIALALIKINQYERAVFFLTEYTKNNPADKEAMKALADSQIKLKDR